MEITREEAQRCNDLLSLAGLPGKGLAFEEHFKSNRKVLTVYENIIFEVAGIEYLDHPQGDMDFGNGIICPKRRFGWKKQRFLYVPEGINFNSDFVDTLIYDGLNDGFPMGIVIEDERKKREFLSLGCEVESEFCRELDYQRRGRIRIYDFPNVPSFEVSQLVRCPETKQ